MKSSGGALSKGRLTLSGAFAFLNLTGLDRLRMKLVATC